MSNPVNLAIVIVAYNRPDALSRLLNDLKNVDYEGFTVPLIISIDYSGSNGAFEVADAFEWEFGEKKIIRHLSNLGLKKHVLKCGDLVKDYDAVIVLEDDLMVSPAMFSYAWRAVEQYKDDKNIAAVSLYTKGWSETAMQQFTPALSVYDTYFIQTAESLGQIWFKNEWFQFKEWLRTHESFGKSESIPLNVRLWDDKSWKKFHIWYCIEKEKYTVYPYRALTRCGSDEGEHVKKDKKVSNVSQIQVPILESVLKDYRFAEFKDEKAVKYDAFLERVFNNYADTCFDLYGQKTQYKGYRYVVTPKNLNYKIVDTYGLLLRPHEDNITSKEKGDYFVKYDLTERHNNSGRIKAEEALMFYNYVSYESVTNRMLVSEITCNLFRVINYRIKKWFRRKKK